MTSAHRWALLPALGAPILHGPVMARDLFKGLKKPLDGGATLRGRRLFGDNKTVRGAIFMTAGPALLSVLLRRSERYEERLPPEVRQASPLVFGALIGASVVIGELPNSFAKRQFGIAPGTQRRDAIGTAISIYDQADWVVAAWPMLAPVWRMSPREAADAFVLVGLIHLPINVIGYAIGARSSLL